jgi:hypothetical protein
MKEFSYHVYIEEVIRKVLEILQTLLVFIFLGRLVYVEGTPG